MAVSRSAREGTWCIYKEAQILTTPHIFERWFGTTFSPFAFSQKFGVLSLGAESVGEPSIPLADTLKSLRCPVQGDPDVAVGPGLCTLPHSPISSLSFSVAFYLFLTFRFTFLCVALKHSSPLKNSMCKSGRAKCVFAKGKRLPSCSISKWKELPSLMVSYSLTTNTWDLAWLERHLSQRGFSVACVCLEPPQRSHQVAI